MKLSELYYCKGMECHIACIGTSCSDYYEFLDLMLDEFIGAVYDLKYSDYKVVSKQIVYCVDGKNIVKTIKNRINKKGASSL